MDPRFETITPQETQQVRRFENTNRRQLRFFDIFHATRKHLVLIIVCAAGGLVLGIALSVVSYMRGEMSKQYAISTSVAVTAQTGNGMFSSETRNPTAADIYLSQSMVDSVIYVMKSDRTLKSAVDRLGLMGVSTKDIASNLSLTQYKETQIIEITLYWRSAEEGTEILSAINEVAPGILIETLRIGSVSVINQPKSRYLIGGSINASMWVYMTAFGVMLGVGFAVLELLLKPTLLSTQDMERTFGVEVLGEIPERRAYFRKKRNLLLESEDDEANTEVVDNYIYLAHIIKNRLKGMNHPIVYVTSSTQKEGKTTVIAHLAVHLAELGVKTLIIDFDTRNPKLGGLFLQRVEYDNSVNALYHGDAEKENTITSLTGKLDILPAVLERRPLPYDDALLDLVKDLKQDYDVVLMDTAPVGLVADTMSLNRLADVALLVVRFDSSSMDAIRESLVRLDKSGMEILGCVVNGVKEMTLNNNVGGVKAYGAHATGRKPYKKREKSEEEREWERWERDRGKYAEDNGSDDEDDTAVVDLEDAFPTFPDPGELKLDRPAPVLGAAKPDRPERGGAEQKEGGRKGLFGRNKAPKQPKAPKPPKTPKKPKPPKQPKAKQDKDAYGDMQGLLDILDGAKKQ